MFPLLGCWPSHVLNSSSRLYKTFRASVMTYDGVESMNFAYWSSCAFTDSSTRAWMVTDFGCLGGALMIAMLSFGPSFTVLSDTLSYKASDSLPPARPKHELRFPAARGGSDPRSPKGSGRDFAARWGRSRL